jgi:predicted amidohydrolase
MQIAAVQLDIQWEDRRANHSRVRKLLENADLPPGILVVLPEMFDVGFSMNTRATDPGEPSTSEQFLRELAMQRNVAVLAGVVARAAEGKLANEAVAFAPTGEELVRYRKMQPFTPPGEHVHYPAGNKQASFKWQGVQIAPFVCYDLRFPELFRPAAKGGAELIVVVANWPIMRSEHWVRLLQARAIENLCYVVGVNRCGSDPSFRYDGRSSLFDSQGNEIFQLGPDELVRVSQVDAQHVLTWRQQFPALRDAKI